ncbi:MAG: organic solvent resistance transporter auxiliary protein [Chloroflexi bacterium]|nr:organic solvent resistance transporter auxiliary protein [Chloroflexota bacterium]
MKHLLSLLLVTFSSVALAQEVAPDVQVKNVTMEVIAIIKQDKDIQAGNSRKIAFLVETRILPHFNFARMTQIAVAVNWRRATPEQQKALTEEFKTLLVRTYSNALSLYRDQAIEFKPLRMRPDDVEVTVKSDIRQRGAQTVTLDYDMAKTPSGWKVFDVKVSGVSLITNYREDFAAQVRVSGIDGLIKVLVSKNRGAGPEKT